MQSLVASTIFAVFGVSLAGCICCDTLREMRQYEAEVERNQQLVREEEPQPPLKMVHQEPFGDEPFGGETPFTPPIPYPPKPPSGQWV